MSSHISQDQGTLDKIWDWITSAQETIKDSDFSLFNFSLGDHGAGDIALFAVNVFFSIITFIVGLFIIAALSQYFLRWVHNKYRRLVKGKIIWSEVIYEGIVSDNDSANSVSQMENVASIMQNTSAGINFGFQFRRPRNLIMIRLDPDDEQAHMYIGVDEKNYDEDTLSTWATKANCSIEPVDFEDIGFVASAPMTMVKEGADIANITDIPNNSTVGGVISRLQSNSAIKDGASVIISYEPMSQKEEEMMEARITKENLRVGGEASRLDLTPRNLNILRSKSPCRATITSYSDSGNYSASKSVLNAVKSGMPALGFRTSAVKFETLHRRAGILCLIPSLLLTLLGLVGFVPLWMPLALAAISMIAVVGLPIMSSQWVNLAAREEGNPPLPFFSRISLRRLFDSVIFHREFPSYALPGVSADSVRYMPDPSQREVIPLYASSMMQFASMPRDGKGVSNISSQAIPQVPMSSSVVRDIQSEIAQDRVALLGTSVRTFDPVMFTVEDLNHGLAVAGNRGSGKTNALTNLYAGISHLSRNSSDYTFTPFWLETKSDDIDGIVSNVQRYDPLVVSVHNRDTKKRVCFEGPRFEDGADIQDIKRNINNVISGMEGIWGSGSFGSQSRMIAHASLTIAMLLNKGERKALGINSRVSNPDRPNVIEVMNLLIGIDPTLELVNSNRRVVAPGKSDDKNDYVLEKIAKGYTSILSDPRERAKRQSKHGQREIDRIAEITPAFNQLISAYNTKDALKPLRNKLPDLLSSDGLWETTTHSGERRQEVPVSSFINYEGPVIVDLTQRNSSVASKNVPMFSMLFHYMLWTSIQENCAGWGKQNKYIPIFVDELKNIVGTSSNDDESKLGYIVGEVADRGRSYGTSHSVGFQRYDQLPPDARSVVKGMTSKIYFALENSDDRDIVLKQLGEKTRYSTENIVSMPPRTGYCIADLRIGGVKRGAFTMKTPFFPDLVEALSSSSTVEEAFEKILYEEKQKISEDKKKKIGEVQAPSYRNDNYDSTVGYIDSPEGHVDDGHDDGSGSMDLNYL